MLVAVATGVSAIAITRTAAAKETPVHNNDGARKGWKSIKQLTKVDVEVVAAPFTVRVADDGNGMDLRDSSAP